MYHLMTRAVAWNLGANILGLIELLVMVGIGGSAMTYLGPSSLVLANTLAVIGIVGIVVIDLCLRLRQLDFGRWKRLFSPVAGGCIAYVPVWLTSSLFLLYLLGLSLAEHLH